MTKIDSILIKGFRGIQREINLDLKYRSVLLFGENGTGKSSITDAIEWFYRDSIKHLSCEEIDRKGGLSALRNISIADTEKSVVKIDFNKVGLNSQESITIGKSGLEAGNSNNSVEFGNYIQNSSKESLILRYEELTRFVLSSKKEKLDALSKVIGFEEVSSIKGILKKSVNDIISISKQKNFDSEISSRENVIMLQLNERTVTDQQYINKINEIIKPLDLSISMSSLDDLDKILSLLARTDNSEAVEQRAFHRDILIQLTNLEDMVNKLSELYGVYYKLFHEIVKNVDTLKKIMLNNLLAEGVRVLKSSFVEEDKCPLCLCVKDRQELIKEIELRIKTFESILRQKRELDECRKEIQKSLDGIKSLIIGIKSNKYANLTVNEPVKDFIESISSYIAQIVQQIEVDISKGIEISSESNIKYDKTKLTNTFMFCQQQNELLAKQLMGNTIGEARDKIIQTKSPFLEIKRLKREKGILDKQRKSLELIYNAFVQKQKVELETFISYYSKEINDYYQYMHPCERVGSMKIIPTEKDDELSGITIEFQFQNIKASPPQKYLSESHLNSLGISLFLASVKAFNKENSFFVLDDIISSFDSDHRKRLGDLILDRFSDYQVFIFTHEKNWFDYMKNIVRGKSDWAVNAINWNENSGTYLNESIVDQKRIIEQKMQANDAPGLGNLMRQYSEGILKVIAEKLEVYVKYQSNERNENRMSAELLSELRSTLNKQPSKNSFTSDMDKMVSSIFIGNKSSHEGSFDPSMGDCRAFWDDLVHFEKLFRCSNCNKVISTQYFDLSAKQIKCKCGQLSYAWKSG